MVTPVLDCYQLILEEERGKVAVVDFRDLALLGVEIAKTEQPLLFVLWEQKDTFDSGSDDETSILLWALAEIWDQEACLYDAAICPLHHLCMDRKPGGLLCGKSFQDLEARESFSGGPGLAVRGSYEEPLTQVPAHICADCVQAYEAWVEMQRGSDECQQGGDSAASAHCPSSVNGLALDSSIPEADGR